MLQRGRGSQVQWFAKRGVELHQKILWGRTWKDAFAAKSRGNEKGTNRRRRAATRLKGWRNNISGRKAHSPPLEVYVTYSKRRRVWRIPTRKLISRKPRGSKKNTTITLSRRDPRKVAETKGGRKKRKLLYT